MATTILLDTASKTETYQLGKFTKKLACPKCGSKLMVKNALPPSPRHWLAIDCWMCGFHHEGDPNPPVKIPKMKPHCHICGKWPAEYPSDFIVANLLKITTKCDKHLND